MGYLPGMTAEHILQELKTLRHAELREVWAQAGELLDELPPPSGTANGGRFFDRSKAEAALDVLDGKFAGADLTGLRHSREVPPRSRQHEPKDGVSNHEIHEAHEKWT